MPEPTTLTDALGPMRDQGCRNTTLVDIVLVFAKRSVGGVGPLDSVGNIRVGWTGHDTKTLPDRSAIAADPRNHRELQFAGFHRRLSFQVLRPYRTVTSELLLATPVVL